MRAGALRHTVRIEQSTDSRDTGGGLVRSWSLLDVVQADFRSAGVGEPVSGDSPSAETLHTVEMRYRTGVTSAMRLWTSDDRSFRILSAVDPDGRRKRLVLTCVEKIDDEAA